jgi:predicted phage tail protein
VFVGGRNIGADGLNTPAGAGEEIRIAPIIQGSKAAGTLQTIIGVVLIVVASIYSGGVAAAFSSGGWAGTAAVAGASMVVGGIVQMLSPQPKGLKNGDGPNNDPSYSFAGPVNTEAQGHPVPLVYGRGIVGSAVISAGIAAEDYVQQGGVGTGVPNWNPKTPFETPE